MNYNHKKKCAWCNKQFHSQREDAKFCSSTCRTRFHKEKSKKGNVNETFNDNVSSISNVSNIKRNVFSDAVNKDFFLHEEIEYMAKNKKSFLKFFLFAHKDEINELIYELNIFSEEEYSTVADFSRRANLLLCEIADNPDKLISLIPKIREMELEYDEQ